MTEYLPGIGWLVVLLLGNAFFVGAEFAVISARRSQIEPKAAEGSRAATTALWAMEHATAMLATSQLGITVCSLLILTVSEPAIHHFLEIPLGLTALSPEAISVAAFVVALVLVTYLHVVFGEMVPKNLAFSLPDRAVLILGPPLVWISRAVHPVIVVLNGTANTILRIFKVQPKNEAASTYTLDEVAGIVEQSRREGTLDDDAGTLAGVFEFTDKSVSDVQVPWAQIRSVGPDPTPAEVHAAVVDEGHSRYVVLDAAGKPRGYLHLKDVMDRDGDAFTRPVPEKRIRRLPTVPLETELEDALALLRARGSHLAVTVDSAGKTVGVLFLEDVIEVLIGEVVDSSGDGGQPGSFS